MASVSVCTLALSSDRAFLLETLRLHARGGDGGGSLAASDLFRAARKGTPRTALAFGFVDLPRFFATLGPGAGPPEHLDNPVAAILFSDALARLREAPSAPRWPSSAMMPSWST